MGGISISFSIYVKANNTFLRSYDTNKPTS